jgi:glycosyltransferase involved in cell wall biosynthesis
VSVNWPDKGAAVVPCLNEAATIGNVVDDLRAFLSKIIVVDDGSTDSTVTAATQAGARVVRHSRNLGKGAALKTGLAAAIEAGAEWAVMLDGDGQHKPKDIPALLACAQLTGVPLVVGNRMHKKQAIPWLRRQVNLGMSRALSHRLGRHLPDTQCGFRWVDLRAWQTLSIRSCHFEIESEMLAAFILAGCRVEFVPIEVIGRGPRSRIRPFRDALRWLRWWAALPHPVAFGLREKVPAAHPPAQ